MEIWKDIPGREGVYQVSNLGRVRTLDRTVRCGERIKKHIPDKIMATREHAGYINVTLRIGGKTTCCTIHRLVAKAFIPNPYNLPCVNHIDGNKSNNAAENLEWCGYSHNMKHAYDSGLKVAKGRPKLTAGQVEGIRDLCVSLNLTLTEIGARFGVSKATVSKIKNRKTWSND